MHFHLKGQSYKYHKHGNRTLQIDQYAVQSGLAYVNPDFKLFAGICSLVLCLLSRYGITSILIAVVMIFVSLHFGRIKIREYWHMIMIPFTFVCVSGIVLLFDISDKQIGMLHISVIEQYLVVTKESIRAAILISTKAMCSITCLYMISLSTPVHEIIEVLYKCKIPKIMIELMYFVYRFIFILLESYHNMKTAADTRLGYITLKRSYDSFFCICSNLFIISFQKASRSFDAMEARCYDGTMQFLKKEKPVTKRQTMLLIVYLLIITTSLVLERILV